MYEGLFKTHRAQIHPLPHTEPTTGLVASSSAQSAVAFRTPEARSQALDAREAAVEKYKPHLF